MFAHNMTRDAFEWRLNDLPCIIDAIELQPHLGGAFTRPTACQFCRLSIDESTHPIYRAILFRIGPTYVSPKRTKKCDLAAIQPCDPEKTCCRRCKDVGRTTVILSCRWGVDLAAIQPCEHAKKRAMVMQKYVLCC